VFKRALLKTEKKRAAKNFLNCRIERINNQRLTSASSQFLKHDCDKHLVTFFLAVGGYSLGLLFTKTPPNKKKDWCGTSVFFWLGTIGFLIVVIENQ